jgi:hypothetical protein
MVGLSVAASPVCMSAKTIFKTAQRRPGRTPLHQGGFESVSMSWLFPGSAMRATLECFLICSIMLTRFPKLLNKPRPKVF